MEGFQDVQDVLDEILNLIESVSEDFPSYSFICPLAVFGCITFLFAMMGVPR